MLGNTITMKERGNFAIGKVVRAGGADGSGRIEDSDFATVDGRFSRSNKAWAQAMNVPIDRDSFGSLRNWSYTVESHPAVLDLYIQLLRNELEKPPQQRRAERAAQKPVDRAETKPRQEAKAELKPARRKNEPSL